MRIFRLTDNVIFQVVYLQFFLILYMLFNYKRNIRTVIVSLIIVRYISVHVQSVIYTIYCMYMTSFIFNRYSSFLALLNFSQIATQKSHSVNIVNPFPSLLYRFSHDHVSSYSSQYGTYLTTGCRVICRFITLKLASNCHASSARKS